jgi:hypothetical protein
MQQSADNLIKLSVLTLTERQIIYKNLYDQLGVKHQFLVKCTFYFSLGGVSLN